MSLQNHSERKNDTQSRVRTGLGLTGKEEDEANGLKLADAEEGAHC